MLDCAVASGRPVPDARLISRLADELAGGWPAAAGPPAAQPCGLLELLAGVTDGRPGRGRDHPVVAVLALAAAAVVAGSRSFTAIAGWAADVPASVLEDLYRRYGAARPGAGPAPTAESLSPSARTPRSTPPTVGHLGDPYPPPRILGQLEARCGYWPGSTARGCA